MITAEKHHLRAQHGPLRPFSRDDERDPMICLQTSRSCISEGRDAAISSPQFTLSKRAAVNYPADRCPPLHSSFKKSYVDA